MTDDGCAVAVTDSPGTDAVALKTAMAYGTVVASFNVEDFSLRRLLRTERPDIDARFALYRSMMAL